MSDLRSSLSGHVDTRESAPETLARHARSLWHKSGGLIIYPESEAGLSPEMRAALAALGEKRFGKRGRR